MAVLKLSEFARVLVCFDHVARVIGNPNHGIMRSPVLAGVADCVAGCIRPVIPEPTDGNASEIRSTPRLIFSWADFVNVHRSERRTAIAERRRSSKASQKQS